MDISNGFTSVNQPIPTPPPPADTLPPPPPATTTTTVPSHMPDPPPPTAGTKRKRSPKSSIKFYAVRVGKEPGIYHSWAECLEQVRGFPKAAFKSFTSLAEAEAFLHNDDPYNTANGNHAGGGGASGAVGGSNGGKFYGVKEGRVPGVYASWPEVLEQITGWKGPKHKVFKTRAEAELFVSEGRIGQQQFGSGITNGGEVETTDGSAATDITKSKKIKSSKKGGGLPDDTSNSPGATGEEGGEPGGEYQPGEAPLPASTSDGFDPHIILDRQTGTARYKTAAELSATKYQVSRPVPTAPIRIYTDGSTLYNGQAAKAIGGVGVYFGPKDKRNLSEPLTGSKQTNQRAELTAILRALEVAPRDRKIVILSDSQYAIKCVTEWFLKWRRNSWLNSSNKPVENKDLVGKVIEMLEERGRLNAHRLSTVDGDAIGDGYDDDEDEDMMDGVEDSGGEKPGPWERGPAGVKFTWVKGHAKDEGNNAADELAVNGARVAKELGEDVVLD